MSRIWSVIFKSILFQKNWTSKHLGKKCWRCWFSYPFLIFGPAYSVSDERSAMTRNYAISLPRHPPGPPSITQPSEHHRHSVLRFKDCVNPHLPPHSSQVTSLLTTHPRWHPENFTFWIWNKSTRYFVQDDAQHIIAYFTQPSLIFTIILSTPIHLKIQKGHAHEWGCVANPVKNRPWNSYILQSIQ